MFWPTSRGIERQGNDLRVPPLAICAYCAGYIEGDLGTLEIPAAEVLADSQCLRKIASTSGAPISNVAFPVTVVLCLRPA